MTSNTPLRARRSGARRPVLLALSTAVALTLAGCGDAEEPTTGSAPAGAGASAAAAAGASAAAGGSDQLAAAQAVVDKLLQPPTSVGVTEPLKSKPTGGSFVYLGCELVLCQINDVNMKEAATAAGLKYSKIAIKAADPATLVAAMQQALAMNPKPLGVAFAGTPEAVWSSQIPAYEKAGVAIVPIGVGETSDSPSLPAGALNGPADIRAQAEGIGNFFITDSGGKGKALLMNVPDVGAFKQFTGDFQSVVSKGCDECVVKTVDISLSQVGTNAVVPAVVAALQRDPSIKYVITVAGSFTLGLQSAAKAAGIKDLQLLGINPDIVNLQGMGAGTDKAFMNIPLKIMAWKAVDVALRKAQDMEVPDGDGPLPLQLLTKDTVGTPEPSIDRPEDYRDQFKKLWLVA